MESFFDLSSDSKPTEPLKEKVNPYLKNYEKHPNQANVDRKFCESRCCAWLKGVQRCGTIYAPAYRKGKCLWEKPTLSRINK